MSTEQKIKSTEEMNSIHRFLQDNFRKVLGDNPLISEWYCDRIKGELERRTAYLIDRVIHGSDCK